MWFHLLREVIARLGFFEVYQVDIDQWAEDAWWLEVFDPYGEHCAIDVGSRPLVFRELGLETSG